MLNYIIREREAAEKKYGEISKEVDELRASMAGGANAKQDLIDKITKLEDARYVRSNFSTHVFAYIDTLGNKSKCDCKRMPDTVSL